MGWHHGTSPMGPYVEWCALVTAYPQPLLQDVHNLL
jgi:hypothetical protein